MTNNAYPFPDLELTEYEKQYVSHYSNPEKPGVLKRIYPVELINFNTATPPANLVGRFPIQVPAQTVQISRRSRVACLVFIGDLSSWFIQISTASGEVYTPNVPGVTDPTNPPGCLVSSMVPGTLYDVRAAIGAPPAVGTSSQPQGTRGVLDIDPNWELSPNTSLVFSATLAPEALPIPAGESRYLAIGVHVFEFPNMSGR